MIHYKTARLGAWKNGRFGFRGFFFFFPLSLSWEAHKLLWVLQGSPPFSPSWVLLHTCKQNLGFSRGLLQRFLGGERGSNGNVELGLFCLAFTMEFEFALSVFLFHQRRSDKCTITDHGTHNFVYRLPGLVSLPPSKLRSSNNAQRSKK